MRARLVRWGIAGGLAVAGMVVLAACDPAPPVLDLTVSRATDGRDAEPGDGRCEVTAGAGDCSLRAAVDEANEAATEVQIHVPAGSYALTLPGSDDTNAAGDLDLAPTGDKVVLLSASGAVIDASGGDGVVDVHSGTTHLVGLALTGADGAGVHVRDGAVGSLVISTVHGNGTGIDVAAGAAAVLHDSTVAGNTGSGIANAGSVDATFTTVTANGAGGVTGSGSTTLTGSVVGSQDAGADCATSVAGSSYAADSDGSCALVGSGDLPAAAVLLGPLAATTSPLPVASPLFGSPLIDAIPAATGPCTTGAVDQLAAPRPFGTGCDIGAIEADFGLHAVVDNPADEHDVAPGDGRCDIGDGTCTLRAAADETNLRTIAGYPNSIELTVDPVLSLAGAGEDANVSGDIDLTTPTNVSGGGHRIDGAGLDRVLDVRSDGITLDLVTVSGGHVSSGGGGGGGVRHTAGHLTIRRSVFADNVVDPDGSGDFLSGSRGGAIMASGAQLEIDVSTIARNTADLGAGIFHNAGGVADIADSTFSSNIGGAYFTPPSIFDAPSLGATFTHVTVAGHVARPGVTAYPAVVSASAGFCNISGCQEFPGGPVTVTASVFDNLIGNCGNTISGGYNVGCGTGPTDIAGPPSLAPLGDFGGPTPTRPSFVGGPGVDLIPPGTPGACDAGSATDQRGSARPSGAGCDSGAVEGDNGTVLVPLTMTVDSSGDAPDLDITDGACAAAGGACTLRAAVDQANAWPSADTVTIGAGVTPVLTLAGAGEDGNRTGDLDSTGALTVIGNGATIDGGSIDRVLDNVSTAAPLAVVATTIRRGNVVGDGGALRTAGPLTVTGSRLADNRATGHGGAVFGPSVTITTTTLEANRADGAGGGARAVTSLTVSDSTVRNNVASGTGGGLDGTRLTLTGSTVEGNQAQSGGGVATGNAVDSTITNSTIRANRAAFGGGGVFNNGTVTILRSTVDANRATLAGWGTGGGVQSNGPVNLTASTVSGNSAVVRGGGIAMQSGSLTSLRSTIHANEAGTGGGGVNLDVPATFRLTTITGNRLTGAGFGAGVASLTSYPPVTFAGSIVANPGEDCWAITSNSGGYNVTGNCPLNAPTDRRATVPALDALADNGGRTRTQLPFSGSPVLNAIPPGTASLCDAWVGTDQRGVARPAGGACDIGSVEGDNGIVPTPRTFTVNTAADGRDVAPNDGVCATAGGTCSLRAAVDEANAWPAPDTIVITAGVDPVLSIPGEDEVANATGDLDLFDAVTIEGNGATVHGDGQGRILLAFDTAPVTLRNVVLSGSGSQDFTVYPGRAVSTRAALRLEGTTVTAATGSGPAIGSARAVVVELVASTIRDNATAGIDIGATGSVVLTRSTVSGNVGDPVVAGELTATGSTISGNGGVIRATTGSITASTIIGGAGIDGAELTVAGSVLQSPVVCIGLPLASGGFNLVSSPGCGLAAATDVVGPVLVDDLADNGGPTATHLPFANSAAVDSIPVGTAGLCTGPLVDQRGVARPVGSACDRGAVEGNAATSVLPLDLVVGSAADTSDAAPGDGVCDDGAGRCTLRAAVVEANAWLAEDTITIAPGVDPVLTIAGPGEDAGLTGDLDLAQTVTIVGNGRTVDGGGLDRVFDILGGSVTIGDLHVRDGQAERGGAIRSVGDLVLDGVTVAGSAANQGGAVLLDGGTAELRDSSIVGNRSGEGGTIVVDGTSALTIDRSTVIENQTNGYGGGLSAGPYAGPVVVHRSTIARNTAGWGGGAIWTHGPNVIVTASTIIQNQGPSSLGGPVTVSGSIVMPSSSPACDELVTSAGYNVVSDASCSFASVGDQLDVDPMLRGLAANGGPTLTSMAIAGSPAIDAIPSGTAGLCDGSVATDQRGVARPQGGACDIGAVEGASSGATSALALTVTVAADGGDASVGDGVCAGAGGSCTLRAAIDEANARIGPDTIVIAPGVDPVLSLPGADEDANASGDLDITDSVAISASGATISAAQLDRVLDLRVSEVSLDAITVANGRLTSVGSAGAGIRIEGGALELTGSTVRDNTIVAAAATGSNGGAGIMAHAARLTVTASTLSGNQMPGFGGKGGAVHTSHSTVVIASSTVTGNRAFAGAGIFTLYSSSTVSLDHVTVGANNGYSQIQGPVNARASVFAAISGGFICGEGLISGGWNLAADTTCALGAAGDQEGVDALLGALAANGGATQTQLPGAGSPAIGAIPAGTMGVCDATTAADQRGVARPQGGACDIGSVEQ